MFDGASADLDGTAILCIIDDDTARHERLLAVQASSLQLLEADAEHPEPTATARGPLPAWMDLLIHAAAGNPPRSDGLLISGDASAFDRVLRALH